MRFFARPYFVAAAAAIFNVLLRATICFPSICVCVMCVRMRMQNISHSYFILCKHATYDNKQQRLTTANEIAC